MTLGISVPRSTATDAGFNRKSRSDDAKPGAILDFDGAGELVSIEILDASRRVSEATRVDFELSKD